MESKSSNIILSKLMLQVAPLPTEEQLRSHTAIPSVVFPSDHVSLVADFEWI